MPLTRIFLLLTLLGLLSAPVAAQQPQPLPRSTILQSEAAVLDSVRDFLQRETVGLPGEVRLEIGALDPRTQLLACDELAPFLPSGARAWGRINVGVRCNAPSPWTLFLSAHIQVFAEYLVSAHGVRAGHTLAPADLQRLHGDLTLLPNGTLTDPEEAVGLQTRHAIAAGQPLRVEALRQPQSVRQGGRVRVEFVGTHFSVSSEGQALNGAAAGDRVRVRMASGQVIEGLARRDGSVAINP